MKRLLFATGNSNKFSEVQVILPDISWQSLNDFPKLLVLDPKETGATFEENARIKAKAYGLESGVATVAEDTGLEVEALNGEPGIYSARWVEGTDQDRYTTLLKRLGDQQQREARFVTVACYFDPQSGATECFQGEVPGKIGWEAKGDQGFGYDPVFIPDGYTQSFGELGQEVKKTLSHRVRAFQKLAAWLQEKS